MRELLKEEIEDSYNGILLGYDDIDSNNTYYGYIESVAWMPFPNMLKLMK